MKRIPWPALALAARFVLAAILLASGLHKTAAPAEEFAAVIDAYQILPADILLPFAYLVPFAELGLAFGLIAGHLTRACAAGSARCPRCSLPRFPPPSSAISSWTAAGASAPSI